MKTMKWIAVLCVLVCACGCDRTHDFLSRRRIIRVDLFDQKLNQNTVITAPDRITAITNQVALFTHGWRENWITLPLPYWSLTFREGTNSVGTLFVGASWMSYGNLIRTSTPEENRILWQAVSGENAQPTSPGVVLKAAPEK